MKKILKIENNFNTYNFEIPLCGFIYKKIDS